MKNPNVILITGASSGIGAALAREYAEKGVKLLLTGRDAGRLADIEKDCRAKGAAVKIAAVDVTDKAAFEKLVNGWDDQEAIDLVIANAGVSGGAGALFESIVKTNIDGLFHSINPLIPRMRARRKGQIAIMSSMAGFRGMPNAPAYSVSKVAARAYGQALRPLLGRDNVGVSIIFPGFIKTPLTDVNDFPMPFLMSPERAAAIIRKGLSQNKARIAFPLPMYILTRLIAALPDAVADAILLRAPNKP